jgi:hydroxymethylpyrimidine/phosphomethylpyrimidine kinase
MTPRVLPVVLAVGGIDPSGGAGLAADLRAIARAGGWGCPACAVLTVQSTRGVRAVRPVPSPLLAAQARAILRDTRVGAIKTGALGSAENVRTVARLSERADVPLVVDPVLRPSRGRPALLGGARAVAAMRALAALATVLLPNRFEAEALLGRRIRDGEEKDAARALRSELGARAVLLKGGHFGDGPRVTDWLALPGSVRALVHARTRAAVHGTGCALAALLAGRLAALGAGRAARDAEILAAGRWAHRELASMLKRTAAIGRGMKVLS